jgi:hypothetical protein
MKYKLITILGVFLLLVIMLIWSVSRYGDALVFKQISAGNFGAAYKSSNVLLGIISLTNGVSSARYADVAVSTSRELALRTPYILGSSEVSPAALAKLASSIQDDERSVRLFIEAGRLANMSFNPELTRVVATKALERLGGGNKVLYEEVILERSYAHLVSFKAPIERQGDWQEIAQREYQQASKKVCDLNIERCRFNEIRWSIGSCIRDTVIHNRSSCIQNEVMVKLGRKKICTGLTDDQCQMVVKELQPYIFQLMSISPAN